MGEPNWIDRVPLDRLTSQNGASAAKVTALLFCAEEDEGALDGVAKSLAADGLLSRIVPGAELDLRILDHTLELMVGPTLATIVVSENLERHQAHRLAETFCIRRSPLHRLLVLELQPGRPQSLLRSMRRASQALTNTLRIDERGRAKLTASANTGAASGHSDTPLSTIETTPVRVYRAPVVVEDQLQDRVGVIPAHVRVPPSVRRSRPLAPENTPEPQPEPTSEAAAAETRPDMRIVDPRLLASAKPPPVPAPAPPPSRKSGAVAEATKGYPLRMKVLWAATAVLATASALALGLTGASDTRGGGQALAPGMVEMTDGTQLSLSSHGLSGAESSRRCQSLSQSRSETWVLPTPKQLTALVAKGGLTSAAYWTQTRPDAAMVVQWRPAGVQPPAPASDGTQEAGSVCLRHRPGAAQLD